MKVSALRKKSLQDLIKHASELRSQVTEARRGLVMGETTDHSAVNKLRKELARTLTIKTEKEKQDA